MPIYGHEPEKRAGGGSMVYGVMLAFIVGLAVAFAVSPLSIVLVLILGAVVASLGLTGSLNSRLLLTLRLLLLRR